MPDAYAVHDGQYIILYSGSSAANALLLTGPICPVGRVQTITAAHGTCSVAETQSYWWAIRRASINIPITLPASFALDPTTYKYFPFVREGMEFKVFPGEALYLHRDAATAGSSLGIYVRYIETDLQYYVELDKHKVLRRRAEAMSESNPMSSSGGSLSTGRPSTLGRTRGIFTRIPRK